MHCSYSGDSDAGDINCKCCIEKKSGVNDVTQNNSECTPFVISLDREVRDDL